MIELGCYHYFADYNRTRNLLCVYREHTLYTIIIKFRPPKTVLSQVLYFLWNCISAVLSSNISNWF